MDSNRFDALTRAIDLRAPRRVALAGVLVGGIVALKARFVIDDAEAKKKHKKKKKTCKKPRIKCGKKCCASGQFCAGGQCAAPCVLEDVGSILRLQANCVTTATIEIPDGVDLDGNAKTIALVGPRDGFGQFGVIARNATVSNLTIDGSGLTGPCDPFLFPVSLLGLDAGRIDNVTLRNNRCGSGIGAVASGLDNTEIVMADVSGIRSESSSVRLTAIALGGPGAGTVAGCIIRDSDIGISLLDGVNGAVQDSDIRNVSIGIEVFGAGTIGAVTNTTIEGPGSGIAASAGASFESGGGGSVTGNTISNFLCGIFEAADAGAVDQSGNTLSGNGNETCVET